MCDRLVKQLADSPVGSMLMANLESQEINNRKVDQDRRFKDTAVTLASNRIHYMDISDLISKIQKAINDTSPWNSANRTNVLSAHSGSRRRLPIAKAIIGKFSKSLATDFEANQQEIWSHTHPKNLLSRGTYLEGQFTWTSVKSITAPTRQSILDWILNAKGNRFEQICYKLRVSKRLSTYEIHSFEDWAYLIKSNPSSTQSSTGRIAPNWDVILNKYDVVHLSWMGILLAHDNLQRAKAENIIPLSYWEHEQTHWSSNCIDGYEKVFTYREFLKLRSEHDLTVPRQNGRR